MLNEIRICKFCGEPFQPINASQVNCKRDHYQPCPICGTPVLKKDDDYTTPPRTCSKECAVELNRRHLPIKNCVICGEPFKPRSGVATICEKEHHSNCVICGKDIIITKRMWHDKINTCSRKCALAKLKQFYRDKYGVDHPMQNSEVQKHHKQAMKMKYGVEHALQSKQFLEAAYNTNLSKFGIKYACLRDECRANLPTPITSVTNTKFGKILTDFGMNITYEKKLYNRAFDICIEDIKTIIEIDPTYSHNSYDNHWHNPLMPEYHLMKTQIAQENGYRCIHVFDWDDTEKIVDLIKQKKKIGARKCILKEVDLTECNKFLQVYHMQGKVYKQLYRFGLYYNNELIQVMTFGKPRYDKSYDIELLRLCTKSGIAVIGGSERLFKHAISLHYEWKSIVSYCDIAKFDGGVYAKLGMKKVRTTPPQEIWSKNSDKITANLLRQRGYDQLFKTNYGKGTSNEALMLQNGWLPVYDCGQDVYELILNKEV